MFFDLNNPDDLFQIYLLTTPEGQSNSEGIISNFIEYLCLLKNLKPGYMGMSTDINLENAYKIIDLIIGVSCDDFVFVRDHNLIVHKNHAVNVLGKYYEYASLSLIDSFSKPYQGIESTVIGELLGYPCPGINWSEMKQNASINYYIIFSDSFKDMFNFSKKYVQISGSACHKDKFTPSFEQALNDQKQYLQLYFRDRLNFGSIKLVIKR